jgi:hypothetical protein
MDPRLQQQQNRKMFFSEQNESLLYGMLSRNFQQKLGSQLNDKQSSRLERGLEHYMSEVFQANSTLPVQTLNKDVLSITASDFNDYLQRQDSVLRAPPQAFQETSQSYDQLQQDRQRSLEPPRPSIPDYVQPIIIKEDDSTTAISLFEEAKKRRNMEMSIQAEEQLARRNANANHPLYLEEPPTRPDPRSMYDTPLDLVVSAQRELPGRGDVNSTLARPGPTTAIRGTLPQDILIKQENIQNYKETEFNLSIYSGDRNWEYDNGTGQNRFNFSVNLFTGNEAGGVSLMPKGANRLRNIVRIEFVKAIVPIETTDMVIRKLDSTDSPNYMQAMVNAQAIAITSVNAGVSSAAIPAANLAQYNLELLKNKNTLLTNAIISYDSTYTKSIYSFPFVTLNVEELDTNTYGTSDSVDSAFGILQYDSNWSDNTDSLGFASLIPKHMKCQRIYSPTPLSTLSKMTIRLQQPNGNLLNTIADTLDINGIFLSSYTSIQRYFLNTMDLSGVAYSDPVGEYIWIDCKKWFGRFQFSVGDRVQFKNLTSAGPTVAVTDLINYIQDSNGHLIAGVAYSRAITAAELLASSLTANQVTSGVAGTTATQVLVDGCNNVGYSRFIIIRGKFTDPTTGGTAINPYGNQNDNTGVSISAVDGNTKIVPGRLINISRQTQLIFRVITREYDSAGLLRPDNL